MLRWSQLVKRRLFLLQILRPEKRPYCGFKYTVHHNIIKRIKPSTVTMQLCITVCEINKMLEIAHTTIPLRFGIDLGKMGLSKSINNFFNQHKFVHIQSCIQPFYKHFQYNHVQSDSLSVQLFFSFFLFTMFSLSLVSVSGSYNSNIFKRTIDIILGTSWEDEHKWYVL